MIYLNMGNICTKWSTNSGFSSFRKWLHSYSQIKANNRIVQKESPQTGFLILLYRLGGFGYHYYWGRPTHYLFETSLLVYLRGGSNLQLHLVIFFYTTFQWLAPHWEPARERLNLPL